MIIEIIMILLGLIFSYFLKDINFLSLQFEFLKTGSIYPDFLLIFIIFFPLHTQKDEELWGIWIGFFGGLLEDSTILKLSSDREYINVIGIHTLVYPILGYVLAKIRKYIDIESVFTILVVTFISTVVSRLAVWILMGLVEEFYQSYTFIAPALYTSVLAIPWFYFLKKIYIRINIRK